ncbi:S8 family serine peptidase [Bradyrhizobium brasilense]|uniref:S8 family serine peptidase n=1 Tax=Bradyrhizobium brasilense TaxID=1419277 RepID=UPI002877E697|nr:S8 family serine peptidase [Bradyrhizobium brasilense]MCP3414242.1 S8 family serine peptidase [Bradyrhizobium brasilense]
MGGSAEGKVQLLVKAAGEFSPKPLRLGLKSEVRFRSRPLFKSIVPSALGAAAQPNWHVVETDLPASGVNQWDLCHAMRHQGQSLATGGIEIIEPDLEQRWPIGPTARMQTDFAIRDGDPHAQDPSFPREKDNFWFRDAAHGQFEALGKIADPGAGKRVRIAHLDTGFDPNHSTRPAFLSVGEQRNYVDEEFPDDATDRSDGIFNNFSHGTGTLSILAGSAVAGRQLGCSPTAEIIPIRVANRVVLFRNSAIAEALDYVHGLCRKKETFVHVVTMSMGGLPSAAWAEAINALYEAGVFVVTAAGNNYANLPSHFIVYPARFDRVVAACGSMADGKPYANLPPTQMAGDYGPLKKMETALSAYTPNTPWARCGEPNVVDFDGAGTSAATPQIAGAAALWIQYNRAAYEALEKPWQRVEAIRAALFNTADKNAAPKDHFGHGKLRAKDAVRAPAATDLRMLPPDDASGAFLDILLGRGAAPADPMVRLELAQVLQASGLEARLDGGTNASSVAGQVLAMPSISSPLRTALSHVQRPPAPAAEITPQKVRPAEALNVKLAMAPEIAEPAFRKLRVFAYDPSPQTDPQLFGINQATVYVPWESGLLPGPVGEYLEVVDVDPASQCCYAPVDLNHPHLLANDGHSPSEANPQFHQQMVYAVAMRTIARFERALGRKALWAPRYFRDHNGNFVDSVYVQRLRIYPHAIRERNAYYSSQRMALLFGYFGANSSYAGNALPGSQIFCAVSHDIIAHETTHALLDGLHPRFQEATNPDVLAFHEAFADIVALFLHFSMPESLLQQVKHTRGDLFQESLLGQLAVQFGESSGMHGALRSAIGGKDEKGEWQQAPVTRLDYENAKNDGDPHALGSILVSAVFAAFITIYKGRSADLMRLATNGTGILPAGEISQDLAVRLANEASTVANQVLNICIRALDYVPPIDITFGEYLRALVTADRDLVPNDDRGYRVAFIAAFRDRGVFPTDVRHLAEDSLVWLPPPIGTDWANEFASLVETLKLDWNLNSDRRKAYETSQENQWKVREWILKPERKPFLDAMGFEPQAAKTQIGTMTGEMRPIEIHSVRPTRRTAPDGSSHSWLVVEITQTFRCLPDGERYRGGCTLMVDLNTNRPRYFIRKRLRGGSGALVQQAARIAAATRAAERGVDYVSPGDASASREAFALLHRE